MHHWAIWPLNRFSFIENWGGCVNTVQPPKFRGEFQLHFTSACNKINASIVPYKIVAWHLSIYTYVIIKVIKKKYNAIFYYVYNWNGIRKNKKTKKKKIMKFLSTLVLYSITKIHLDIKYHYVFLFLFFVWNPFSQSIELNLIFHRNNYIERYEMKIFLI